MINNVIMEGFVSSIIDRREATADRIAYVAFVISNYNRTKERNVFLCEAWGYLAERIMGGVLPSMRVVVFGSMTSPLTSYGKATIHIAKIERLFGGRIIELDDEPEPEEDEEPSEEPSETPSEEPTEEPIEEPTIDEILKYHQDKEEQEEVKEEPKEEPKQEPHYLYTDEDIENELKELERKQREEANE